MCQPHFRDGSLPKGAPNGCADGRAAGGTTMAVRQHLAALQEQGLVDYVDERRKVGRPARVWHLTPKANDRFPDRHAELAVGILQAVQSAPGEEGLERLVEGLSAIPGIDLTLTTNGFTLKEKALKAAALQRVTVSLDSLDNTFPRHERRRLPSGRTPFGEAFQAKRLGTPRRC